MAKTYVERASDEARRSRGPASRPRESDATSIGRDTLERTGSDALAAAQGLVPGQLRLRQRTVGNRAVGSLIHAMPARGHRTDDCRESTPDDTDPAARTERDQPIRRLSLVQRKSDQRGDASPANQTAGAPPASQSATTGTSPVGAEGPVAIAVAPTSGDSARNAEPAGAPRTADLSLYTLRRRETRATVQTMDPGRAIVAMERHRQVQGARASRAGRTALVFPRRVRGDLRM